MSNRLVAALVVLAAGGCRMCSDSCDYSPPVAGSPHNAYTSRAGSAFSGEPLATVAPPPNVPAAAVGANEPPPAP